MSLNCKQASVLLSRAQENALGWRERWALRLHLLLCDGCRNFGRQLELLRSLVRRYRDRED